MLVVIGEQARRAIAVVNDLVAGTLQALDQAGGAECGRSFFCSRKQGGSAGRCADQGNLLRLTDDFDRQDSLLVWFFGSPRCAPISGVPLFPWPSQRSPG